MLVEVLTLFLGWPNNMQWGLSEILPAQAVCLHIWYVFRYFIFIFWLWFEYFWVFNFKEKRKNCLQVYTPLNFFPLYFGVSQVKELKGQLRVCEHTTL